MNSREVITIRINGTEVVLSEKTTLAAYLREKNYVFNRIAVEYNGEILKREQYETIVLNPEDQLEIVSFVGGG